MPRYCGASSPCQSAERSPGHGRGPSFGPPRFDRPAGMRRADPRGGGGGRAHLASHNVLMGVLDHFAYWEYLKVLRVFKLYSRVFLVLSAGGAPRFDRPAGMPGSLEGRNAPIQGGRATWPLLVY